MSDIVLRRGSLDDARVSFLEHIALTGLKTSAHLLKPTHFKGYGRIAAVLRRAAPQRHIVLKLDSDCNFRFPFGDAYWSRLLASDVVYEPEMLSLYRLIRDEDYCFVDCGANFGYWTILVTGASLGNHPAIAIEASGRNVAELRQNAACNSERFEIVHAAVADFDGGVVSLGGPTHEGLAIVDAAHAGPNAEQAPRVSLDGLLSRSPLLQRSRRIVLKLDVEGVEEAALKGAAQLLDHDTLLVYEEQGSDKSHANTRFVSHELGMAIFIYTERGFIEASNPVDEVAKLKKNPRRGYNLVATRSSAWAEKLRTVGKTAWTLAA